MDGVNMVIVDIKRLTRLLNKFCIDSLNKAAGICLSRRDYEITIEHALLSMTESSNADIQLILRHFEIDPARILRLLQRDIESLKTGNPGTPVLSPMLMEWIQDAWLIASVEYDQHSLGNTANCFYGKSCKIWWRKLC